MRTCFVIMPIGSGETYEIFHNRYENLIKPAVEGLRIDDEQVYECIRADLISQTGSITQTILKHIDESDAVIADLSELNPNVFYELGVRQALHNKTILIALNGTKPPFDLGDLRLIFYDDRIGSEKKVIPQIQALLKNFIESSEQVDSPVFLAIPQLRSKKECECDFLGSREAMYIKARNLIEKAKKNVIDTTWGPDAPELTPNEDLARKNYIEARRDAVMRGVSYQEVFTDTQGKRLRLQESASDSKKNSTYQARKLTGFATTKPVIDFMVVDSEYVVLSHVRSEKAQNNRFMLVKSEPLALFFTEWFYECWEAAKPVDIVDAV